MAEYHYDVEGRKYLAELDGLKKDVMASFGDFNSRAFANGALFA